MAEIQIRYIVRSCELAMDHYYETDSCAVEPCRRYISLPSARPRLSGPCLYDHYDVRYKGMQIKNYELEEFDGLMYLKTKRKVYECERVIVD